MEKIPTWLWSISNHCTYATLVGLWWVYSGVSFMRLGFLPDSCWSHSRKWVLQMRKGKALEWDPQGYYTEGKVTKEVQFLLNHFFQLRWKAAAFGQRPWEALPPHEAWASDLGIYFIRLFQVMLDSRMINFIFSVLPLWGNLPQWFWFLVWRVW